MTYVKASEGRLREFRKSIEEVHLTNVVGGFLRLDVSTRWNATYMMLESAIRYRRAFINLSYNDKNYRHCPSIEEWERAEKMCAFLAPFYNITNLISGSSYTTSNLYFMQVALIEMELNVNLNSEDGVIKDMAIKMKEKFDKYWSEYSTTLAFGNILDPTSKLDFLNFCFEKLYPSDYEDKEYHQEKIQRISNDGKSELEIYLDEKCLMNDDAISNGGKSELEIYLDEKCLMNDDVDILQYWKLNSAKFPQLAIMACDILSIPITTVASESTFSIGGRILNKCARCREINLYAEPSAQGSSRTPQVLSFENGVLNLKLKAYENLGISPSVLVNVVVVSPCLLVGDVNFEFVKVVEILKSIVSKGGDGDIDSGLIQ
ncbi:hypothetical protein TSUD_147960 [Trifolium subterraneum]|uniref:HAT C-terminal dimerisation domain-containing protein n=1 Tax=Trifolium subterraneum TaxID=3900 RepID=A0A2Z6N2W4_TRISU|nr:hypothetical protein TSUD_147960 [Trifolium subterraneum]